MPRKGQGINQKLSGNVEGAVAHYVHANTLTAITSAKTATATKAKDIKGEIPEYIQKDVKLNQTHYLHAGRQPLQKWIPHTSKRLQS